MTMRLTVFPGAEAAAWKTAWTPLMAGITSSFSLSVVSYVNGYPMKRSVWLVPPG